MLIRRALLAAVVVSCFAVMATGSLRITDFLIDIDVLPTGELMVTETLGVLFDTPYHGIYREIPVSYRQPTGENITIDVNVRAITLDDSDVQYTAKRSGRNLLIRIGNPDSTVFGYHTYTIHYTVDRALLFSNEEYIQLYWNATGNEWQIPIDIAVARVRLPKSVTELDIPTISYVGYVGSTARGKAAIRDDEGRYVFGATDLAPGEGLTIDIAIPREASGIEPPSTGEKAIQFLVANKYALLPILTLLVMLIWWWRRGKDPAKGVIAPRFDLPSGIRAGEAGVLIDDRFGLRDVSAMVIELAVKGFLKIREVSEEGQTGTASDRGTPSRSVDYEFTKLRDGNGMLTNVERLLLDGIFDAAHPETRTLSSMENSFYKILPSIESSLYARLIKKRYYVKNPEEVRTHYFGVGLLFFILGVALGVVLGSLYLGVAVGACGMIVLAFSSIMPRKTKKGVEALREVLGLAEYIGRAEVQRLEFHDAPERRPREFEKILPYAIALNLTKVWSKQFEGLLVRPPEWYAGANDVFHGSEFGPFLISLTARMQRALPTAPRTHSRGRRGRSSWGGSAYFGGGYSGGGFGGGGGGGW